MSQPSHEVLREAVARHRAAILSLPKEGAFRHCKTRFLAEDARGVWIETITEEIKTIDEAIEAGATVGVAFKAGPNKAMFATTMVRRERGFQVGPGITASATLLKIPEKIEGIQRRADYRVDVTPAADAGELTCRVWAVPEDLPFNERPPQDNEMTISVRDLSISGVGIFCAPDRDRPADVTAGNRVRILMTYKAIEVMTDGYVRHTFVTPQKITRVGVLFTRYDQPDLEKHRASRLQLIVGALRREEMRRLRLELLSPAGTTARSPAA